MRRGAAFAKPPPKRSASSSSIAPRIMALTISGLQYHVRRRPTAREQKFVCSIKGIGEGRRSVPEEALDGELLSWEQRRRVVASPSSVPLEKLEDFVRSRASRPCWASCACSSSMPLPTSPNITPIYIVHCTKY